MAIPNSEGSTLPIGRLTASQSGYSAVQLGKIILDRRKRGRFLAHDGLRAKSLVHASSPSSPRSNAVEYY